jgi:hypothetical protein
VKYNKKGDNMENSYLPDSEQQKLRSEGVISQDEVAIKLGDILLAENVISRERRQINRTAPVNEGKRLLRD